MKARPSLFDIIFIIWAMVVPIGFGYRLLNSDGDLARHLRVGEVMLERRAMLREDLFSHTMGGQPFLAFEWGSEVVQAAAYRLAGLAGVAILSGLLLALTYALVARFLIRRGADPLLAYFVSMAAAVLSAAHWLARPHLFTMLGAILLLELLTRTERRSLWPYAALFIVWANLHGGFFYGCILIALFGVGELIEAYGPRDNAAKEDADRAVWLARAKHHFAALGLALAASVVNPHGLALLAHVTGFFRNSTILRQTQEFMSPDFHTINGKIFLLVLLLVMGGLAMSRRRPSAPVLLVLLVNVAFALLSQRNIELFALTALPLVALHLDPEWRALPVLRRAKAVFQREHQGSHSGVGAALASLLLVVLALAGGKVGGIEIVPNRFDNRAFPAAAVEHARAAGIDGRMFNYFIWGGYLIHQWPEQRVFIDGATDFYGEKLFGEYIQTWNLDPGWRDVMHQRGITLALIPPASRLAHELLRHPEWSVWYCDSTAALLRRGDASRDSNAAVASTPLKQCGAARPPMPSTARRETSRP